MSTQITIRVSILIVSALASGKQLGYYSASFRIIEVLAPVPGLLVGAAFPIFARAARDDHARLGYALGRVFEVWTDVLPHHVGQEVTVLFAA